MEPAGLGGPAASAVGRALLGRRGDGRGAGRGARGACVAPRAAQGRCDVHGFMAVAVDAWNLWRSTSGEDWYAASMLTLAEAKLALGYDPGSLQGIRDADGTKRVLSIRRIAVSTRAWQIRERIKAEMLASVWLVLLVPIHNGGPIQGGTIKLRTHATILSPRLRAGVLSRIIPDTLFVICDTNRRPTQDRTAIFAFPVAIRSASMNPMRVRTQCHSAAPRAHETTRIRDDRNLSMHAHPLSADRAHVHLPPRRPVGLTGPAMLTDPCISLLAFRLLIRRPFLRTAAAARTPVPADADYARHEPARTAGRPFHPNTVTGPCRRRSSPPRARTRPCSAVSAAFTRPCP